MPFPLGAMLASGGMSLLGGLFGGRKQETGYQMSSEEKSLLAQLKGQIGNVPGHITAPFVRMRKRKERELSRQPGVSGIKSAELGKIGTMQAEAAGAHERGLLAQIASLVGGRGTQTTTMGAPWGDILGGIGGDIGFLWGLEKMMGGQGAGRKVV